MEDENLGLEALFSDDNSKEGKTTNEGEEGDEFEEAIGFIQNLSPLKKGNYVEFQIQTQNKTMRGVCFSPSKRKELDDYQANDQPVKIRKFLLEKTRNSEDIIVNEDTCVESVADVGFIKTELPRTITVSTIKSLCVGQVVSLKAKIAHLEPLTTLKPGNLKLREGIIIDPTGTMKMVFWQEFAESVVEGETYDMEKIRIKKDHKKKEVSNILNYKS